MHGTAVQGALRLALLGYPHGARPLEYIMSTLFSQALPGAFVVSSMGACASGTFLLT